MKKALSLGIQLNRSEMKNVMGGSYSTCTVTYADGSTAAYSIYNVEGTNTQCRADYWCTGNDDCANVDCAGTGAC